MVIKFSRIKGFSLIELLITLSIVGILAGIAYPSYLNHVEKVRRLDGQIALLNVALHLQKYHAQHQEYKGATLEGLDLNNLSPKKHYTVSISELTASSYILTAIPTKSQVSDKCKKLILTESNEKNPSYCW